ncbi:MAG: YtxH domain-containing protein [Chloroflexi bacterium]|nr:YtxH domain-containing protein [Chloroflexota bacterium]
MSGVLFGVAVGATLMYLFDPRQGVERREVWGERLKKGREQAQSAVETGRTRVSE